MYTRLTTILTFTQKKLEISEFHEIPLTKNVGTAALSFCGFVSLHMLPSANRGIEHATSINLIIRHRYSFPRLIVTCYYFAAVMEFRTTIFMCSFSNSGMGSRRVVHSRQTKLDESL